MKPDAPKTVTNRKKTGSGGNIVLTLMALVVLGFAVARLGPAAAIKAAEPILTAGMGLEAAQAQIAPDEAGQSEPTQIAQAEHADWGAAFGVAPPPPPRAPEVRLEPVARQDPAPSPVETVQHDRSGDYWLTGHILAGADSIAIVHDGGDEQVVRTGSTLSGGETVIEISQAGVVAQYDSQTFLIVLRDDIEPPRISRQVEARPRPDTARRAEPARRSFLQQARSSNGVSSGGDAFEDNDDWEDDDWDDDDWDDDDDD